MFVSELLVDDNWSCAHHLEQLVLFCSHCHYSICVCAEQSSSQQTGSVKKKCLHFQGNFHLCQGVHNKNMQIKLPKITEMKMFIFYCSPRRPMPPNRAAVLHSDGAPSPAFCSSANPPPPASQPIERAVPCSRRAQLARRWRSRC